MKHSELKEMIRRAVRERALTKAEKKKKEDIVKGMKKTFKGDKASMYAIATAKAKEIAEVQGTELTQKIFDIGATLKKVEAAMDFGIDQDPEIIKGLDQAYAELLNILNLIERDREERRFVTEGSDHEVAMAQNSLKSIAKATIELNQKLGNEERNIPGWIQDHIAKAENYIEQAAQGFHELKMEEKDPLDVVVAEKKAKDQDDDGDIDSEDWKISRDIAIKQAIAKKK